MTGKAATESADQQPPPAKPNLVREESGESPILRFFVDTNREKPTRPANLNRSKSGDTQRKLLGTFFGGSTENGVAAPDDAAAALRAAGAAVEAPCEISPNPLSDADKIQNTSDANSAAMKQWQLAGQVPGNYAVSNGQNANAGDIEEAKAPKTGNATHLEPSPTSIPGAVADAGREPPGQVALIGQGAPQASSMHVEAAEGPPVKLELSGELKILKGVIAVLLLFVVIVAILAGVIVVRSS